MLMMPMRAPAGIDGGASAPHATPHANIRHAVRRTLIRPMLNPPVVASSATLASNAAVHALFFSGRHLTWFASMRGSARERKVAFERRPVRHRAFRPRVIHRRPDVADLAVLDPEPFAEGVARPNGARL